MIWQYINSYCFLSVLKSLYFKSLRVLNYLKMRLDKNGNLSVFFGIALGLKQVEPLSPILFVLYVNDINDSLDFNNLTESDFNRLASYLFVFADDIALFTADKNSLLAKLDALHRYFIRLGITINVSKTKVCIFRSSVNNVVLHELGRPPLSV